MRKTLSVAMLILTFCCTVSAGIIHNPPPAPAPLLGGNMPLTVKAKTVGAETAAPGVSDSLLEITVDLLAVLPALF